MGTKKKVAFLGPKGSYTHLATEEHFNNYEAIPCSTITEIIESGADAAVIPFENSLGGGVKESMDVLKEEDVEVTAEQEIEIDHMLVSKEDSVDNIETVKSHPQALEQSREFLESKDWDKVEASSTAKAAKNVEGDEAAIASSFAAELYGLNVLEEDIQDTDSNRTRFLIINNGGKNTEKTSLVVEPAEDRPGVLGSILSCFSSQSINLSYIQSRPTKEGLGNYYFYIETEAGKDEERMQNALEDLENYAEYKIIGSY